MMVYKDKITGDEMLTDVYKMTLIDDVVYEVQGKMVTETTSVDESKLGSNASAEGVDAEGTDESAVSGIDIVIANNLVETTFTKKQFMSYIKDFMKALKAKLALTDPDRVDIFTKGAQKYVQTVVAEFKEYRFFIGESMEADGSVALCKYNDVVPYLYYFKDAYIEEKV